MTECCYAECRYAECRQAECRYAECRGTIKLTLKYDWKTWEMESASMTTAFYRYHKTFFR